MTDKSFHLSSIKKHPRNYNNKKTINTNNQLDQYIKSKSRLNYKEAVAKI